MTVIRLIALFHFGLAVTLIGRHEWLTAWFCAELTGIFFWYEEEITKVES